MQISPVTWLCASIICALLSFLVLAGALVSPFVFTRSDVINGTETKTKSGLFVECRDTIKFGLDQCEFGWNASLQNYGMLLYFVAFFP